MFRTRRWIRIGILSLVLGLLVGVGTSVVWRWFEGTGYHLKTAQKAYEQGLTAFSREDRLRAEVNFQEAMLSAENAIAAESATEDPTTPEAQKKRREAGLGYWLKAKAIRGLALTKNKDFSVPPAGANGIAAVETGFSSIPWTRLGDDKLRNEAIISLREAAMRLPDRMEVQREGVALEIQADPPEWSLAHLFASQLHAIDPKDERAIYLLTRHEFEQPIRAKDQIGTEVTMVTPLAKRSRERMIKARGYIAELKQAESQVRYRTLFMEARIAAWLFTSYRQPENPKPEAAITERQILDKLIFDNNTGSLALVAAVENIAKVSRLDLKGVFGLHDIAVDLLMDDSRTLRNKENRPWAEAIHKVVDQSMTLAEKIAGNEAVPERVGEAAEFIAPLVNKVMPYLATDRSEILSGCIQKTIRLCEKAFTHEATQPQLAVHLANLLLRHEATSSVKTEPKYPEILRYLQAGIKQAQNRNWPLSRQWPLYEAMVRTQIASSSPRDTMESSLKALHEAKEPAAECYALFYEGVLAEKEGRLVTARQQWESCLRMASGDLVRKIHTLLIPVYLDLKEPHKALGSVRQLEKLYARYQKLGSEEQQWMFQGMTSPEEVQLWEIQALCGVNQQFVKKLPSEAPAVRADMQKQMRQNEEQIGKLIGKIPVSTPQLSKAKLLWIRYLSESDRIDQATTELANLKSQHKGDLSILRTEIDLLRKSKATQPASKTQQDIDEVVMAFVRSNPNRPEAKLFQAEWLVSSNRAGDALAVLNDLANDPKSDPVRTQRLRAVVLALKGDRTGTNQVIEGLPRDPLIDLLWVGAASNAEEQKLRLESTLSRHQNEATMRCLAALATSQRGDDLEALKQFTSCLEHPQAVGMARDGMQSIIYRLCQTDPTGLRTQLAQGLNKFPSEPMLLWGYAFVCLKLGDFGSPTDRSNQVKDMATALEALAVACKLHRIGDVSTLNRSSQTETAFSRSINDALNCEVAGNWFKAQFWASAKRPDIAWPMLQRTVSLKGDHLPALSLAVQLAEGTEQLQQCQKWVNAFRLAEPKSLEAVLLEGQLFAKAGQWDDAESVLSKLLLKEEKSSTAYSALFRVLMKQHTAARKLDALSKAETLLTTWGMALPNDMQGKQARIAFLAEQGKVDEARRVIDAELQAFAKTDSQIQPVGFETNKREQKTAFTLSLIQGLIQGRAWDEAESRLKYLSTEDQSHTLVLPILADVQIAKMNAAATAEERTRAAKAAEMTCWQLYSQRKSDLNTANNLAWLLVSQRGDSEEALKILNESRAGKSNEGLMALDRLPLEMLDTYGEVYHRLNKQELHKERKEMFEAAIRRFPQDPRLHAHLGLAYQAAGERKLAEVSFSTARKLLVESRSLTEQQRERVGKMLEK